MSAKIFLAGALSLSLLSLNAAFADQGSAVGHQKVSYTSNDKQMRNACFGFSAAGNRLINLACKDLVLVVTPKDSGAGCTFGALTARIGSNLLGRWEIKDSQGAEIHFDMNALFSNGIVRNPDGAKIMDFGYGVEDSRRDCRYQSYWKASKDGVEHTLRGGNLIGNWTESMPTLEAVTIR